MPLTDDEKNRIHESEILRKEIQHELKDAPSGSAFSRFFQHQAVLLALGFLLTTSAGSWLTYFWKERDWLNQQAFAEKKRTIERKSALIEKTFKEAALTMTSAEDILNTYYGDDWSQTEIDDRWKHWNETSVNWRINSKVLAASIAGIFSPNIQSNYEQLVDQRTKLGNAIGNLPRRKAKSVATNATYDDVKKTTELVNRFADALKICGANMTAEAK